VICFKRFQQFRESAFRSKLIPNESTLRVLVSFGTDGTLYAKTETRRTVAEARESMSTSCKSSFSPWRKICDLSNGMIDSRASATVLRVSVLRYNGRLYQNCYQNPRVDSFGISFERKADSLNVETLKADHNGQSPWKAKSCLKARCSTD